MKKSYILFLIIVSFNLAFSQQIGIPFRDGKKWGIANEKAELIIEATFDSVEFYDNYSNNYEVIISKVKNLKGLIINGKEILPPIYETIYEKGGKYVIIKTENNVKKTDVLLPDGTSILTQPIAEIIKIENFSDRFQMYHVVNLDGTESVFIFNPTTNTISQWLYENYYSLDLMKLKALNTVGFKVKKTQNNGLEMESWDFSKLPSVLKNSTTIGKSEAELMQVFMKKTYEKNGKYGSGSGNGGYAGEEESVYVTQDMKGDYDMGVVAEPTIEGEKVATRPIYISKTFKIDNEKLVMVTQPQYSSKGPIKTTKIKWKIPIKDIEIKGYALQEGQKDTIIYHNNTVIYKKNGRTGFLYSENTKNTLEFDSITKNFDSSNVDQKGTDLVFMVANLDAKTKRYKYGFYSFKNKLLTPVKFDKLTPTTLNYSNGEKSFIAQENGKFGLVSNAGREILPTDNDEIIQVKTGSSSDNIIQIKKDNKYRFLFQKYGNVTSLSSVTYDYPVKNIMYNYPNFKATKSNESTSKTESITLLKLVDNEGNDMGYADLNGTKFYKN